jgi:hypothetical protein
MPRPSQYWNRNATRAVFLDSLLWSGVNWLFNTATVLCPASYWTCNCSSRHMTLYVYATPSLCIMDCC